MKKAVILRDLQEGLPLVPRPFAEIGARHGINENEVMEILRDGLDCGEIRRFGGIFESQALNHQTMLCAVHLPAERMSELMPELTQFKQITHCYERGWSDELPAETLHRPQDGIENLWFTVIEEAGRFEQTMQQLQTALGRNFPIQRYPAKNRYKIKAVFDPVTGRAGACGGKPKAVATLDLATFDRKEQKLIQLLQSNLPINANCFDVLGAFCGLSETEVLDKLSAWKRAGLLRRLAVILRHYQCGIRANGMCLWEVPEADLDRLGTILAKYPEVSHCYHRQPTTHLPHNLYAMIHSGNWADTYELFQQISTKVGLPEGKMLCSLQELKKTSPVYF